MADFSAFKDRPCPEWYADAGLGIFIHWEILGAGVGSARRFDHGTLPHQL